MTGQQDTQLGKNFGEYRLLHRLGGGTFGAVYLAEHLHRHSLAAIKLLHAQLARHEDFKDFINEARTVRLDHPSIVRVLDFGVSKQDVPYLVMEYASGGTLNQRHPPGSRLALSTVLSYTQQIASALQYAHDQRIIHRDVKPENMLVRGDGTLLLSDFGIAKVLESSSLISLPTFQGTPAYMAPEQSAGNPCFASDQYALGVVLYEWITGQRPFQGSLVEVSVQHRLDQPPALTDIVPDLPSAVEQVVLRALKKDPAERFATVQVFARALHLALQTTSIDTRPVQITSLSIQVAQKIVPSVREERSQQPESQISIVTREITAHSPLLIEPPPIHAPSERNDLTSLSVQQKQPFSPPIVPPMPAARRRQISRHRLFLSMLILLIISASMATFFILQSRSHGEKTTTSPVAPLPITATKARPGMIWHTQDFDTLTTLSAVAWGDSQFVALGSAGTILTSLDGNVWTPKQNISATEEFNAVTWGDSQFVAMGTFGGAGTDSFIFTSPDGRTWTFQQMLPTNLWSVTWGDSQFVAVGDDGAILTSPDGHGWTAWRSANERLFSVTWGDSQFVAVGIDSQSGNSLVLTSPNGHTWTERQSLPNVSLSGVTWGGTRFVAVGRTNTGSFILTSPDGHTWMSQRSTDFLLSVTWGNSRFVAVGSVILTSPDGHAWKAQSLNAQPFSAPKDLLAVTWGGTRFVAVGRTNTGNGLILTSS